MSTGYKIKVNGKLVDKLVSTPADKARLADMLASRRAPRVDTDDVFFADHEYTVKRQMEIDPVGMKRYIDGAKRRGYNVNMNDVYCPAIAADSDGDPLAFVPRTGGKGHIKKVAEMRNKTLVGAVNYTAEDRGPPPAPPALSNKLIREKMSLERMKHPDASREELRERIIKKHAPKHTFQGVPT